MDNNNRYYNKDPMFYDDDINNEVFSSRYDFNDRRYDSRFDRRFDPRYDRNFYDRMRYYRFPFCDRYGRCENPIWWMFWPFFFL
jgi:hypothetical protein